jgi:2-keto-4-pentenoate hydratase/2-oxohepta-3-ene-1,7-dioic acid hydratase in catechol pathway
LELRLNSISLDNQSIIPSKVVCIGRNYVEHIAELGNQTPEQMVVFIKPNSAISSQLLSFAQEPLHYEAELSFVYQQGKFVAVGLGLDLTKRELQAKLKNQSLPWERAKSFDGSAVFSEFVALDNIDASLTLELQIDDVVIQAGGIAQMLYQPDTILADLQTFLTLEDGDIVMTGTPKGVGIVKAGSRFSGKVLQGDECLVAVDWLAK